MKCRGVVQSTASSHDTQIYLCTTHTQATIINNIIIITTIIICIIISISTLAKEVGYVSGVMG